MSHEVETMFFTREEPWHGLGVRLPAEIKAAEAIAAAGLDWTVTMRPVYYLPTAIGTGYTPVPDARAVVRDTDDAVLGMLGPTYHPLQNRDAFEFFDTVVGRGQAVYHTAGSLFNGRLVWIMAKLTNTGLVRGVDPVDNYLLLVNGHDGGSALRMHWTPIRVVCWNTLRLALARAVGDGFYARHTSGMERRTKAAQDVLGLATVRFDRFMEDANRIANASFLKADMDEYLKVVLDFNPVKGIEEQVLAKREAMARIEELVETGAGLQVPEIRGTKWALYNAVTEWLDHERATKAAGGRLNATWFGAGVEIRERAWKELQN